MVRLRKQARHCNFETSLTDNLRDQLIEKLTDFELKRKLLEQRNITLEEALDKAHAWEAAGRQATNMTMNPVVVDSGNAVKTKEEKRDDKPRKATISEFGVSAVNLIIACDWERIGIKIHTHMK